MADLYRSYIVRVRRSARPGGRVWVQVEDLLHGLRRDVTGPSASRLSDGLSGVIDGAAAEGNRRAPAGSGRAAVDRTEGSGA